MYIGLPLDNYEKDILIAALKTYLLNYVPLLSPESKEKFANSAIKKINAGILANGFTLQELSAMYYALDYFIDIDKQKDTCELGAQAYKLFDRICKLLGRE